MIDIQIDEERIKRLFFLPIAELILVEKDSKYNCIERENLLDQNVISIIYLKNFHYLSLVEIKYFNDEKLIVFLQKIVKHFPFFSDYELLTEGQNCGTVFEFINNKQIKIEDVKFLYHGTSSFYSSLILKEGLKPRNQTNVAASFAKTNEIGTPEFVYLCVEPRYVVRKSTSGAVEKSGGSNKIMKIDINGIDLKNLFPCEKIQKIQKDISINESLIVSKNLCYYGSIDPQYITEDSIANFFPNNLLAIEYYQNQTNKN
jgi:hypothetical protein